MSGPTLTDLVDDALAVLAPGARLATLYHHPQVAALYAALPRYEAALAVAEACEDLVRQMNRVHESQAYYAVWAIAQLHRGPYAGPQYGNEHAVAEAAIAAYRGAIAQEEVGG